MKRFYATTAIDYVNSKPHLGHAYEKLTTDAVARWHRLRGEDVHFLTGTDENASKNAMAAKDAGKPVQAFVNEMAARFLELCKTMNVSYDDFIRTTEERHRSIVQKIFQRLYEQGDIYKGKYDGLYCYGCEAFCLEKDLKNGKCPVHGTAPERVSEDSYFFRMSAYQKRLLDFYAKHPDFVLPKTRMNEMTNRIKDGLKDLSVSRQGIEWGIPVPFDSNHKVYVWFDALLNYVTALGYPDGKDYRNYWPADYHFIGVDINWFHSVIWPCVLMALGMEPPKHVFVHGFIKIGGEKMSKSRGAVVDPFDLAKRYGTDQVRYFLLREIPFGEDGDFSENVLKRRINGELAADLGNLVNRVLTLSEKTGAYAGAPELALPDLKKIDGCMERLELHHALEEIFAYVKSVNKYVNDKEPWKLNGAELGAVLYNLLEALRMAAILISPFMPGTAEKINKQLGVKAGALKDIKFKPFAGKPKKGEILFQRV